LIVHAPSFIKGTIVVISVIRRARRVRLHTSAQGKNRRFCTIIPVFCAKGVQPTKLPIIFAAQTGERLAEEAVLYHPNVLVQFQPNAWADTKVLTAFAADLDIRPDSLLYLDCLKAHTGLPYSQTLSQVIFKRRCRKER